jgi:uncharacterized protein
MSRERIGLDTNVLISGALSRTSTPAQVLELASTRGQLLASRPTLRELIEKLRSRKFDPYVSLDRRDALLFAMAPLFEIVEIVQTVHACRDAGDDQFLEVAVHGRADIIVSGTTTSSP